MKLINNEVIPGAGLHHVSIRVADFDQAVEFYKEGLGFEEKLSCTLEGQRMIQLDAGNGGRVEIFSGGREEAPSEGRIIHFCIRTTDCDAAHARALAAGAVESLSPRNLTLPDPSGPIDVRLSFVITPSGERLEFLQGELI